MPRHRLLLVELLSGPLEARYPHVSLPTGRDGSYSRGCVTFARTTIGGHAIGPLDAPVDWERGLTHRFHALYPNVPDAVWEHHGPKYEWLLNFQVKFPT